MRTQTELDRIQDAVSPEAIFGNLAGSKDAQLEAARKIFRQLAKIIHPDAYQGTADYDRAEAVFKKLNEFWDRAQASIANGTYGTPASLDSMSFAPFVIRTRERVYRIQKFLAQGDLCTVYACTIEETRARRPGLVKVSLRPSDNDLVANEARILTLLRSGDDYDRLRHFVPELVESFTSHEERSGSLTQVNTLSTTTGLVSLKEVKEAFPTGIDAKDMAWIWRRLLVALGFAHMNAVIHGAVLPTHVLIQPEQHGLVLIDWSYAVLDPAATGERISALSSAYRAWYPDLVFARQEPAAGLDIALAARCMIELLGGDPIKLTVPGNVPWQIKAHLQGCVRYSASRDYQEVSKVLQAFDDLIERLWGPRTFRVFALPQR